MSTGPELPKRMRREAHEKLDRILDQKTEWRYPLVVTVTVEAPVVRAVTEAREADHSPNQEERP